jgi:hypothetical protein
VRRHQPRRLLDRRRFAIFTCEFGGMLVKIDLVGRKVLGYLKLSTGKMPQDIRVSPDGSTSTSPT